MVPDARLGPGYAQSALLSSALPAPASLWAAIRINYRTPLGIPQATNELINLLLFPVHSAPPPPELPKDDTDEILSPSKSLPGHPIAHHMRNKLGQLLGTPHQEVIDAFLSWHCHLSHRSCLLLQELFLPEASRHRPQIPLCGHPPCLPISPNTSLLS